mmetsp:Transcript_2290/g.3381  ORF Transcript_2290/g.3381 Transcript_2290/m.3381 type:complete len:136 (-) Transcript_2290:8-415(-)
MLSGLCDYPADIQHRLHFLSEHIHSVDTPKRRDDSNKNLDVMFLSSIPIRLILSIQMYGTRDIQQHIPFARTATMMIPPHSIKHEGPPNSEKHDRIKDLRFYFKCHGLRITAETAVLIGISRCSTSVRSKHLFSY